MDIDVEIISPGSQHTTAFLQSVDLDINLYIILKIQIIFYSIPTSCAAAASSFSLFLSFFHEFFKVCV